MKNINSESYTILLLYFSLLFMSLVIALKTIKFILLSFTKIFYVKNKYETLRDLDLEA